LSFLSSSSSSSSSSSEREREKRKEGNPRKRREREKKRKRVEKRGKDGKRRKKTEKERMKEGKNSFIKSFFKRQRAAWLHRICLVSRHNRPVTGRFPLATRYSTRKFNLPWNATKPGKIRRNGSALSTKRGRAPFQGGADSPIPTPAHQGRLEPRQPITRPFFLFFFFFPMKSPHPPPILTQVGFVTLLHNPHHQTVNTTT